MAFPADSQPHRQNGFESRRRSAEPHSSCLRWQHPDLGEARLLLEALAIRLETLAAQLDAAGNTHVTGERGRPAPRDGRTRTARAA